MEKVQLSKSLSLSRLVHGEWRLAEWGMSTNELVSFIDQILDLGISSFDHADIYGDYTCESIFGKALKKSPALRDRMEIITKCGIRLVSEKHPGQKIPYYDQSYFHIIHSVEHSLRNLNTDHIDLLLIHRPSPMMDPEEIALAFSKLKEDGKVLNFGVSNFTPIQFDALDECCDSPLVTNQIEISPYCIEHFENDTIPHLQKLGIKPMVWSPLAGGRLFSPTDVKGKRVAKMLKEVGNELGGYDIDKVAYNWLLMHPAQFLPIVGSGKIERVQIAIDSLDLEMTLEQWFRIYTAALGSNVP